MTPNSVSHLGLLKRTLVYGLFGPLIGLAALFVWSSATGAAPNREQLGLLLLGAYFAGGPPALATGLISAIFTGATRPLQALISAAVGGMAALAYVHMIAGAVFDAGSGRAGPGAFALGAVAGAGCAWLLAGKAPLLPERGRPA